MTHRPFVYGSIVPLPEYNKPIVQFRCGEHDEYLSGKPYLVDDSDHYAQWKFDIRGMYCPSGGTNDVCREHWRVVVIADDDDDDN